MKTDIDLPELLSLHNAGNGEKQNETEGWLLSDQLKINPQTTPYIIEVKSDKLRFYETNFEPLTADITSHKMIDFTRHNLMYSYTIVCYPLSAALGSFPFSTGVKEELENFLEEHPDALPVYVVGHKTGGHRLLVSVGGDCYRPDRGSLFSMLTRIRDLATGMLCKSSLIFPDIPQLSGGKKGEFGVLNSEYNSISTQLSTNSIFELSSGIMPIGIQFLNRNKILGIDSHKCLKPDSLSPDVFTGKLWSAYVENWLKQGIDPNEITCIPSSENPLSSSAPTAAGVVESLKTLSEGLLNGTLADKKILIEGYGGVGSEVVNLLIDEHGVSPVNITVVDIDEEKCITAESLGVVATYIEANEFYRLLSGKKRPFDIWVNNGVGDTVGLQEIVQLISAGVKIFIGGANNLFRVSQLDLILDYIAQNNSYAFPDYACSAGGWTMAVLEQVRKTTGDLTVDMFQVIKQRNVRMVQDALEGFTAGMDLWRTVAAQAEVKIKRALEQHNKLTDADFEVRNWSL